jgi:hypothetical protein
MAWRLFSFGEIPDPAAAFRRVHEVWLTRALSGENPPRYPRIPIRRVDRGGFDRLMARPNGRKIADEWWDATFSRLDED